MTTEQFDELMDVLESINNKLSSLSTIESAIEDINLKISKLSRDDKVTKPFTELGKKLDNIYNAVNH